MTLGARQGTEMPIEKGSRQKYEAGSGLLSPFSAEPE